MMKQKILEIINEAGIEDVGFCAFAPLKEKLLDCRAKERLPKDAKTVITCLFPYKVKDNPPQKISRYAAVPDYHTVCGGYLEKICEKLKKHIDGYRFVYFTDNSPIPEVYAAAISGLGVIGKNGLLISRKYGTYVFIGEIVTDLDLKAESLNPVYCNNCGKCTEVCPKEKIGDCLSAISQKKGELSKPQLLALKKYGIVWGCDICSEVCPENKTAKNTYIKEFIAGYRDKYESGEEITGRAYEWRGKNTVERNFLNLTNEKFKIEE